MKRPAAKNLTQKAIDAIIARGFVTKTEAKTVFAQHYLTKLMVSPPGETTKENIWVARLKDGIYAFANNALTFYPNMSWGCLCFTKDGHFDFKATDNNLKRVYETYTAHYGIK